MQIHLSRSCIFFTTANLLSSVHKLFATLLLIFLSGTKQLITSLFAAKQHSKITNGSWSTKNPILPYNRVNCQPIYDVEQNNGAQRIQRLCRLGGNLQNPHQHNETRGLQCRHGFERKYMKQQVSTFPKPLHFAQMMKRNLTFDDPGFFPNGAIGTEEYQYTRACHFWLMQQLMAFLTHDTFNL
jgi:hypothetical protein